MIKRRVNVRAIILRGDNILAVIHKKSDGSEEPYWATPGGGLDPMESMQDGVKREVMEELGVEAVVKQLLFVQQFHSKREEFDEELEFFFLVEDSPAYDTVDFTKTTHGSIELSRIAFVDPHNVDIKPQFLSDLDIVTHVQEKRPVAFFTYLSR